MNTEVFAREWKPSWFCFFFYQSWQGWEKRSCEDKEIKVLLFLLQKCKLGCACLACLGLYCKSILQLRYSLVSSTHCKVSAG